MTKKILLVGASLNSGNRGVNALTRGTINAILDRYENIDIKILSYSVNNQIINNIQNGEEELLIEEIPCNPYDGINILIRIYLKKVLPDTLFKTLIKRYDSIYNEIINADLIMDISEGDSFSDIYGIKRFIIHSTIKLISIKLKKKIILLPQTIGSFKNYFVKKVARYILNNTNYNFVRDMISYNLITKEFKISEDKVMYKPDMAFYMTPKNNIILNSFINNLKTKDIELIGINVSGLLYNGGYTRNNMFNFKVDYQDLIHHIIEYFMQMQNTKILLIPHVITDQIIVENDLIVCKKVFEKFKDKYKNRIFTIDKSYREHELKSIIGKCDFFIGSRMHSCIAAIGMIVPTIPIAYSRKFKGVWNEFGLGDCVADPRQNSIDEILRIIEINYKKKKKIRLLLGEKMKNIKNEILSIFDEIEK